MEDTQVTGGISRRKFLALGAAATAAAATAGTVLVGCSKSDAAGKEENTAVSKTDPIPPVDPPAKWDKEVDVVVAGAGGGLVGAARALDLGASVIVLEKSSVWGGASKETDVFSVMGSQTQEKLGVGSALTKMPPEVMRQVMVIKQTAENRGGVLSTKNADGTYSGTKMPDGTVLPATPVQGDPRMLKALANAIPDSVDWIGTQGVTWEPVHMLGNAAVVAGLCPADSEAGGFVPRANMPVFETMYNNIVKGGGEVLFDTPITAVVMDGDKVVGAQATKTDGTVVYIKANKGVLLATGGFTQNIDLLKMYAPSMTRAMTCTAPTIDDGDGLRIGLGAGGYVGDYDTGCVFDGGVESGQRSRYLYKGDVQLARQPWLGIDVTGRRYPYHSLDTIGFPEAGPHLMSLPGNNGYVIFDADYQENIRKFPKLICRNPIWPEMADEGAHFERVPDGLCEKDWRIGAQQAIDGGWLFKCNTLDELADKLGLVPATLKAAVDNWNAICEKGVDEELHFHPDWLMPVAKAPYYGMKVGGTLISTYTGLVTDATARVVGKNGAAIEGLYAAGCNASSGSGDLDAGSGNHIGGGVAKACATAWLAVNTMLGATKS
ncbi:MAG: FAD-binding protein [Coriobacteriia bacterium]